MYQEKELNQNQEQFCIEYTTIGQGTFGNQTKAYRAAYPDTTNDNSAAASASALLRNPNIQARINELHKANLTRNGVTVESVLANTIANGITVARGLFCGAQAGILAYGRKIGWKEKVFEYDSQFGVEVSSIYGFSKSKFNFEDFGVITCDTRVVLDS